MRCEAARDLIVQRSLGELDQAWAPDLEDHLAACQSCRAYAAEQARICANLAPLRNLEPLPSQRAAVLARLPGARRQALARRLARGTAAVAAAALLGLAAFGAWRGLDLRRDTAAPVVTESVALPSGFLDQARPGAGWVATAGLPTPAGQAIVYFYLEPAAGDRVHASVLLRRPDGRLTREIDFGPTSFGRAPFTHPEFYLLNVGGKTQLAIATDDEKSAGRGVGRLWVIAYETGADRLALLPFDGAGNSLAVTDWPVALSGGIQTVNEGRAVTWTLTPEGRFKRQFGGNAGPAPQAQELLAQAEISTPGGNATARLQGTLIGDASIYLVRPGGQRTEEIQLGRPHFGALAITQPALHQVSLGETEVLVLLSDPLVSQPHEAVVRVIAYDPVRGKLRLVPFASGEVLVDQLPAAAGGLLTTVHPEYRSEGLVRVETRWRITESWLLERTGERVLP